MKDGIIELDSEDGKLIGFTSDKFVDAPFASYLWKEDDYIIISWIQTKFSGLGHLSELFNAILAHNYGIKVPTPLGRMRQIVKAKGFTQTVERGEVEICSSVKFQEPVEIWELRPSIRPRPI